MFYSGFENRIIRVIWVLGVLFVKVFRGVSRYVFRLIRVQGPDFNQLNIENIFIKQHIC